jgi:L-aminopeptidase/D-esterase-like protein
LDRHNAITDVDGITVGHYTDKEAATGCTVVLCESGAVGGVDVRGSSPGTRETDVLRPTTRGTELHGVLLSGGSLFGLDAASGVVRYLEEKGVGMVFGGTRLPIVAAAVLFDLGVITDRCSPWPQGRDTGPWTWTESWRPASSASPGRYAGPSWKPRASAAYRASGS